MKFENLEGVWISKVYKNYNGKISFNFKEMCIHPEVSSISPPYGGKGFIYGITTIIFSDKTLIIPISGEYDYNSQEIDTYRLTFRNSSLNARDTQYIFTIPITCDNIIGISFYSRIIPVDHGEIYITQ